MADIAPAPFKRGRASARWERARLRQGRGRFKVEEGLRYANLRCFASGTGSISYRTKSARASLAAQHGPHATWPAHRTFAGVVVEDRKREACADHFHAAEGRHGI